MTLFGLITCFSLLRVTVMSDRVVMTNNGPVQGITIANGENEVEAYWGIPYAEPPIGRLRFQKPVPKTPWMGVYDASSLPPPCSQNGTSKHYYLPDLDNMSEDCLYLNIWAPHSKAPHLKHVLIYIYGGTFNTGATNMKVYDGTKLAQRGDIIFISINFRVGILGYFTSLTEDAIGNFGLYDQILALKWIKANIKAFGGDPNNIVLMGESAGAMTIAGHLVSPITKNLFKRVILQSGGGVQGMILDDNKRLMKTSHRVASKLGCADEKLTLMDYPRIVVNCLKRLTDKQLVAAEGVIMSSNAVSFFPRVGDEYLPKPIIDYLREGEFMNAEMIIGVNEEEGNAFLTAGVPQFFGEYGVKMAKSIGRTFADRLIHFIFKTTEQANQKEIANYYSNAVKNNTPEAYAKTIGQSLGDYFITCNALFSAEFHSMKSPVYFYLFTRRPSSTVTAEWVGATHFDEVQYTFGNPLFDNFTEEETKMSNRMMNRWIAFVKTGVPNIPNEIEWPRFTINNTYYLDINNEDSIGKEPFNDRCEFWRDRFRARIDETVVSAISAKLQHSGSQMILQVFPLICVLSVTLHLIIGKLF